MFKTSDANALVHPNKNGTGRIDAVDKTWRQSLSPKVKGKVRPLPFKTLRKTGASLIEHLDGSYKEVWNLTGVSETGELRGTIELDTVTRRGS